MKAKFDQLSLLCSKKTTLAYSTSFSLGIKFLDKRFHDPVYAIYGFVRFADEIVDSFHDYNKRELLQRFSEDTYSAIKDRISLNPILNSFQQVVHTYEIGYDLIDCFLKSMKTDLDIQYHTEESIRDYILGSAEVVGLMCLKVFTEGNKEMYENLKPAAMKLGSAFQKVNFLRDARSDFSDLNRNYFPAIKNFCFSAEIKREVEKDIDGEFNEALQGIRQLPSGSRRGVYLAYYYYRKLFNKIKKSSAESVMTKRIRINNGYKIMFMFNSYLRHQFGMF